MGFGIRGNFPFTQNSVTQSPFCIMPDVVCCKYYSSAGQHSGKKQNKITKYLNPTGTTTFTIATIAVMATMVN